MKPSPLVLVLTLTLTVATVSLSQNPPGVTAGTQPPGAAPGSATAAPAQKAKPFSPGESHALIGIAESLQFQMNMSQQVMHKLRETDAQAAAVAARIHKESTELWTPMLDLASAHGVDGKKIPMAMSKTDKAFLTKLNTIKEADKWKVAFFDMFAKETKKNAHSAEVAGRSVTDPDLKSWVDKVVSVLTPQAEQLETTYKELKSAKKK